MIKKGLLLTVIFILNGCVGTAKIAKNTEIDNSTTKTPVMTKNGDASTTKKIQ